MDNRLEDVVLGSQTDEFRELDKVCCSLEAMLDLAEDLSFSLSQVINNSQSASAR